MATNKTHIYFLASACLLSPAQAEMKHNKAYMDSPPQAVSKAFPNPVVSAVAFVYPACDGRFALAIL